MSKSIEAEIQTRLDQGELYLNEKRGQHFLVNQEMVDLFVSSTLPGAKVIEIGSGIGHITEAIAKKASRVIGIEIDRKFQPALEEVQSRNPNISFMFNDALTVSFASLIDKGEEAQVVGNVPFHLIEPLLNKLVDLPISSAVLIVGEGMARELRAQEDSLSFGKMSLLAQTFFDVRELAHIPKESFFPPPGTDTAMLGLEAREATEVRNNPSLYIFASLFRKAGKFGPVKNDVKQAITEVGENMTGKNLSKQERHRRARSNIKAELRQISAGYNSGDYVPTTEFQDLRYRSIVLSQSHALDIITRMGISQDVLNTPFFRLNNSEVRHLTNAIKNYYNV